MYALMIVPSLRALRPAWSLLQHEPCVFQSHGQSPRKPRFDAEHVAEPLIGVGLNVFLEPTFRRGTERAESKNGPFVGDEHIWCFRCRCHRWPPSDPARGLQSHSETALSLM